MKIIEKTLNSLIPYEWNNKIHDETQINRIANSIKEFWFTQPVVIDKNNIIIVWHGRVEGAKRLWLKTIPCIKAENLTDEQIKKYRILDNKLNESDRDIDNLKLELKDLPDFNIWDIDISVPDLFPEFDAPEFNPEDYIEKERGQREKKDKEDGITLSVFLENFEQANICKEELQGLWYKDLYITF